MKKIALVGKPNSGKSSLFNLLTGLNQKIGNYAGVTVEKKTGFFEDLEVTDLPGLNSMWPNTIEEEISQSFILNLVHDSTPVVFVANANQLSDNLILFSELADLQIPVVLVLNFMDEFEKNKSKLDVEALESRLNCRVCMMNSRTGAGLEQLKSIIHNQDFKVPNSFCLSFYDIFDEDTIVNKYVPTLLESQQNLTEESLATIQQDFAQRQMLVNNLLNGVIQYDEANDHLQKRTKQFDKILLHPIWGILIFLSVLLLVFQSVFSLSTYPMDWIDASFSALSEFVTNKVSILWLADLISNGIIPGLAGVVIFIPQIAILFFLLGILENTGYLSRISNLSDRFLQKFGLSGKSIIPLMSSWACAIPAIMSARTIDDQRERLSVILAAPLMTCSARLPVYTILIAVFIEPGKFFFFDLRGLALLVLYLFGLIGTLAVAYIVSKRSSIKDSSLWTLEMPLYRTPNWRNATYNMYLKTRSFVVEAGKIIFMISIVLWFLASFSPRNQSFLDKKFEEYTMAKPEQNISRESVELEYSYAGYMGKLIEPAIRPLGYDWKIGIALITSFAAREVFVGTLSTIYSVGSEDEQPIIQRLKSEKDFKTGKAQFDTATSVSLLLFYVFALQCMSTLAIVRKETGKWKYAIYQFLAFTIIAYLFALGSYQIMS
jgi:ferrous iron transport protein B